MTKSVRRLRVSGDRYVQREVILNVKTLENIFLKPLHMSIEMQLRTTLMHKNVETMTTEGLKEKFTEQPVIEDRPITDKELDNLLEGFEEEEKGYIQNEEQTDETLWQKTKEHLHVFNTFGAKVKNTCMFLILFAEKSRKHACF